MKFSNIEYADIVFFYGQARGSALLNGAYLIDRSFPIHSTVCEKQEAFRVQVPAESNESGRIWTMRFFEL